ncbi:hypothetical protein BBJ28_00003636 [Nothophytophthora sp. Chile5]|nr:hypothetical protein BBJ28_00003636 [Nothophytophthora sp. Chile5]
MRLRRRLQAPARTPRSRLAATPGPHVFAATASSFPTQFPLQKWKGLKQRTAWRYKTLKDANTAIVFSAEKQKEVHFKTRNRRVDDPMACHNVLAVASTASLNGILAATSPEDSSEFCKTMVGFMLHSCTPSERAKVLDVITKKRLEEISIANRALIVRAIQRCLLSPLIREKSVLHSAANNVICGTFGLELSILKEQIHLDEEAFIDTTGRIQFESGPAPGKLSYRHDVLAEPPHAGDLIQLIYGNKNVTEVVTMMQHIAIESLKVKEQQPNLVKVVSDIDDTLFPGWIDRRYPLHIPYPGVSDLFARLSHGFTQDAKGDSVHPSITFLTARPRGWLSVGRYLTLQHLKSLGVPNVTVLNGSVKGLVSNEKIASLKLDNFTRFASLFPEFKFVFVGDSGQGDALLASRLLESCPDQVLATFIHNVNPIFARTGDGGRKSVYAAQGVEFFATYAGAALAAHKKGLVSAEDVLAVAAASEKELEAILFLGPEAATTKEERRRELQQDLERIDACLHARADSLVANGGQTLFACANLATPLGTYRHAVLRDEDVAQLERPLTAQQLRALVLE